MLGGEWFRTNTTTRALDVTSSFGVTVLVTAPALGDAEVREAARNSWTRGAEEDAATGESEVNTITRLQEEIHGARQLGFTTARHDRGRSSFRRWTVNPGRGADDLSEVRVLQLEFPFQFLHITDIPEKKSIDLEVRMERNRRNPAAREDSRGPTRPLLGK